MNVFSGTKLTVVTIFWFAHEAGNVNMELGIFMESRVNLVAPQPSSA